MADFADGYALRALMESGGTVISEVQNLQWKFPDNWPEIPEPSDYEIVFLVNITDDYVDKASMCLSFSTLKYPSTFNEINGYIDWRDGITTRCDFIGYSYVYTHFYKTAGLYIVKLIAPNTDEYGCCRLPYSSSGNIILATGEDYPEKEGDYPNQRFEEVPKSNFVIPSEFILAMKVGSKMTFYVLPFNGQPILYKVLYCKFCGESAWLGTNNSANGIPQGFFVQILSSPKFSLRKLDIESTQDYSLQENKQIQFRGVPNLYDFDFLKNIEKLDYAISPLESYTVKRIDLNKCTKLHIYASDQNIALEILNAPNAVTVEYLFNSSAYRAYNLKEIHIPKCSKLPQDACGSCPNLQILEVAEGCDLNGNTFPNCPLLEIKYAPTD